MNNTNKICYIVLDTDDVNRMPGTLVSLDRGGHLVRSLENLRQRLRDSCVVWEVEVNGPSPWGETFEAVTLVRPLTWNPKVARLWACDCAERVVSICDIGAATLVKIRQWDQDEISDAELIEEGARVRNVATRLVRDYGYEIDAKEAELIAAEYSAGFAAAFAAGVLPSCSSEEERLYTASISARYALESVAHAGGDRAAEEQWQNNRLLEYLEQELTPSDEGAA